MKDKSAIWGVFAVLAVIALALVASSPIPRPKARASRISGVNNVRSVSLTLTNANVLPSAQPAIRP